MKGFELNSGKIFIIFCFITFVSLVFAEAPFSVSAPLSSTLQPESENSEDATPALISRLKQDAIIQWLRQYLGNKAVNYEKLVTAKFAESYILDYKVAQKGANKDTIELSGHLDTEALKGWLRLADTKDDKDGQIRPSLIMTDSLAEFASPSPDYFGPEGSSNYTQIATSLLSTQLKKLNLKATPTHQNFSYPPPRDEKGIDQVKNALATEGTNSVIWLYLNKCRSCESPRLDIYLYSLEKNGTLLTTITEELPISLKQLDNVEKAKGALTPIFNQFHQVLEQVISEGKFTALPLTITIEGIENYLEYRKVDFALGKQTFFSDWLPKAFVQNTAQFETVSNLTSSEVAQRIESLGLADVKLISVRVDSRNIVMRYSR